MSVEVWLYSAVCGLRARRTRPQPEMSGDPPFPRGPRRPDLALQSRIGSPLTALAYGALSLWFLRCCSLCVWVGVLQSPAFSPPPSVPGLQSPAFQSLAFGLGLSFLGSGPFGLQVRVASGLRFVLVGSGFSSSPGSGLSVFGFWPSLVFLLAGLGCWRPVVFWRRASPGWAAARPGWRSGLRRGGVWRFAVAVWASVWWGGRRRAGPPTAARALLLRAG